MRAELLAEARAVARDPSFSGDPAELMLAAIRTSTAHCELVAGRVYSLPADATDALEWHRVLDRCQRTAAEAAARGVALNLQERRARTAERIGAAISGALEAGLAALGDALTPELRQRMITHTLDYLETLEDGDDQPREPLRLLPAATGAGS